MRIFFTYFIGSLVSILFGAMFILYLITEEPEIGGISFSIIFGTIIFIGPAIMAMIYRNTKWGKAEIEIACAKLDALIDANIEPLITDIESTIQRDLYGNVLKDKSKHAIAYFLKIMKYKEPMMPEGYAFRYIRKKLGYD